MMGRQSRQMFPPVRACEHGCYAPDRLTPEQAAAEKIRYDKSCFTPAELRERWGALLKGEAVADPDSECQELPTERIRCRAGSSTTAPQYMCAQTRSFLEQIRADSIWKTIENGDKN